VIKTGKKRAISPVIATLILIVVAVVAGVAVYGFVTGFIAQTTSQSQAPSSIVIDAASLNSGTDSGSVVVRNIGQESTTVVAVYVLSASDQSLVDTATMSSTSINAGQTASISLSGLSNISSNTWYIVKVVTSDGSSATIKVKAS
jgi:flagellin-like protein